MFYNVDIRDTMLEHSKLDPQNVNDSYPPSIFFFLKSTKYDRFRYLILDAQTTYSTKTRILTIMVYILISLRRFSGYKDGTL